MTVRRYVLVALILSLHFSLSAQTTGSSKKYPSLFWEITGNGLKKPSYLFGTMHVSSKMVFHLSDSFYHAMRSTDAVALELNPEVWQDQMFRLQKAQIDLGKFTRPIMNDYINEKSFQLQKYEDDVKRALNEEPTVVNNLLYRSYQTRADFEENTYLDLYIYQTGRKLGKQPAGVEDYMESERLMLEAYADMAKEKSKKTIDTDGESMFDLEKKMQEAYRKGDLDLMDSLQRMTETSAAFTEKFLFLRNTIQANSIDTILKKQSLFVGVGAAHLPGPRGVIELLRKKGYHLRPIFMQDRDAEQKEKIDKLKVPVTFQPVTTSDGFVQLQLPGQLYKREEARTDSWQYADMNNGSYYMLTRVRTHAGFAGFSEKTVLKKVDSLLYENIPGKILKKTAIVKNGYNGFDITNKTRRGDLQRYQIIVTPYEVLTFKMSGNDTYVDGKEADIFFNSIKLKDANTAEAWMQYEPKQGGFTIKFPQAPTVAFTKAASDRLDKWEYEAIDNKTGNAFMVWKKSVYNFNFLEEDTFDLALIEESLQRSELINKQVSRRMGIQGNIPFIEAKYSLKDGAYLQARAFVKGPHYYLIAARTANKSSDLSSFFNSFSFTPFKYPEPVKYVDSVLNIEVMTAVQPNVDTTLRSWIEKATNEETMAAATGSYNYWPKNKTGVFKSDETGEMIFVSTESFPRYYYSRDTAKFWRDRMDEKNVRRDFIVRSKEYFKPENAVAGYRLVLNDTNSSRSIVHTYILKDNQLFKFSTITDTLNDQGTFIKSFFGTGQPVRKVLGSSVFENKLDVFFTDYKSKDSAINKRAKDAIANVYFGKDGIDRIADAIDELKYTDKDYFDLKTKFITELGYIDDSCCADKVVGILKNLYAKTADTSSFQNPILIALARLKTNSSYAVLKELLVQDPPIFENTYEYGRIFTHFSDTLSLARTLFPELLQLSAVEDYRFRINSLLRELVDSNYITAKDYESYFTKLSFDAKIQLKKQQAKDEKRMEEDAKQDDEMSALRGLYTSTRNSSTGESSIYDYAVLLLPYYDKNPSVQRYFEKLLQSNDPEVQMNTAILLIRSNKKVPDTLLQSLASKDTYRAKLLSKLERIKKADLFPSKYKTQEYLTTSLLLNDKSAKQFADVKLVSKKQVAVKGKTGWVYLYKYKLKKEDDWKLGISGIQPINDKEVSSNSELVKMTDKKLKADESLQEQFDKQIKQMLFAKHKSSRNFFSDSNMSLYRRQMNDIDGDNGYVIDDNEEEESMLGE
jgi:uncharacterized protein YbaP (TraB family)